MTVISQWLRARRRTRIQRQFDAGYETAAGMLLSGKHTSLYVWLNSDPPRGGFARWTYDATEDFRRGMAKAKADWNSLP